MDMVVSFYILGIHAMANRGLIHIAKILKQLNDELKLDNDKWEKENGQSNVLPTSDAGTRTVGRNNNESCSGCKKQSNTTTGE
jgi:hypothetical protein